MATAGKVIKCQAAVSWEPSSPLVIEEIEVAPPQENEIRIKVIATGVCKSDLYHLFNGNHKEGFPTVLGHEGAGVVESVGPGVTEFKPGDKVIPLYASQCRECRFCKSPKTNLCEKNWSTIRSAQMSPATTRFTCRGKPILQFMGTSTFSEYTVLNQISVAKIHNDAPLNRVCLLGCAIPTGYGAAINNAKDCSIIGCATYHRGVCTMGSLDPKEKIDFQHEKLEIEPGSVCAVFGLGAVGLAAVMGCKNAGASRIIAVDINEEKFEKAKVFGATEFVNPKAHKKPISEVLIEMTSGGVDYSLECVGNVAVMRSALESCSRGWGVSVIVGWTDLHDFSARPIQLISGKTWKGSMFGGFKGKDSVPKLVLDYMAGRIKLHEFVTHTVSLEQVNEAIELMKTGKCIRTIVTVSK